MGNINLFDFINSKEIATYQGEYINLLGVLDYAVFDKNGKQKND